ncbi:MAG: branched-chain amino acid ABC transporter permease [Burkholderiaceae bacterium]|nr:branched-chain amino acid ABC transporter permease [Burkholderiaceae bacterium]
MKPSRDLLAWLGFSLFMLALPLVLGGGYYLNTLVFVAIYALPAIGLCLLVGYCGQLSISHSAFFAIGAYTSAVLSVRFGVSPWFALALAMLLSAVVALFIGWVVLRLRGHYLAIATLSFTIIVEVLIKELPSLTGGLQGLSGIPRLSIAGAPVATDQAFYWLVWPIMLACLWLVLNLARSRIGRVFRAIREGEAVTGLLGVDVRRYKILAFVLSSMLASLGGSLYAHFVTFVSPAAGSVMFAIDIILVLAFGGFDRVWGAMLGVFALTYLNEYAVAFADYKRMVFGIALIGIMWFFPTGLLPGLAGYGRAALRRVRGC